ncbi:hypothetical protein K458DRAFT_441968 [Lentithecium fluviatile CBS 122367]|uniref:BTB domain-containing protein n=1 Tax=Lentithecium fluviatile CBS 122367 TaxID=1168545 RepID=A0A6G1J4S1_9PLEO|nr:hypothetical protein K458DRAFT_441968 [Lentithecium fluviatile CBS 122367]
MTRDENPVGSIPEQTPTPSPPPPNSSSASNKPNCFLHTTLLTQQSPYFRAALTGPFLESTAQTSKLEDVSIAIFGLLVSWLYIGALSPPPFKDGKPAYYTLLHLYTLADRFCFESLRNYIVDLISDLADSTNSVLTPSDTRILYEQISESAKICELMLDLFAHTDRWHAGFLRDLCRHRLRMWCPDSWHATRACDIYRVLLPPRFGAVACDECCCVWCAWKRGTARKWESCKPWRGVRCRVYYEHVETEACGYLFMGR